MDTAQKTNGEAANEMNELLMNQLLENVFHLRRRFLNQLTDPRRDIDAECGFPESLTVHDYRSYYDREGIATRLVNLWPDESWQSYPWCYEDEDPNTITEFESAWEAVGAMLRGSSWHEDPEVNPLWEYLHRADRLSGIGTFGVILIGLDDGKPLRTPAAGIDEHGKATGGKQERKILYLRVFDESLLQVTRWNTNGKSPRYGHPEEYLLTFHDLKSEPAGGIGLSTTTEHVHWSRVVHLADNLGSSELFGRPRMQNNFNRLYDVSKKLLAGSAEMYWQGARPGLALQSHPQLGARVKFDANDIRDQMEQYQNHLQRFLAIGGAEINNLAPQVVDPTGQIDAQIMAICISEGIPKRIFMGSERGELASSQDDSQWNDRLKFRQRNYLIPRVIVPFVNRLIALRVLPVPKSYKIVFPDLNALSDAEMAEIMVKRTAALVQYISGNGSALIQPIDYLTKFSYMPDEEALQVMESTEAALMEEVEDDPFSDDVDDGDREEV